MRLEYTFDALYAGKYALQAKVVTINYDQTVNVAVNDETEPQQVELPFTCGMWKDSETLEIDLKKGKNTLTLMRLDAPQEGIAIKSLKLKPLK